MHIDLYIALAGLIVLAGLIWLPTLAIAAIAIAMTSPIVRNMMQPF